MKKLLYLILAACTLCWQSCDDNDDLWDAVNDLKSRVKALETQVQALNDNIEALQQLYSGATITGIEEKNGTYVLTLSNGETITLSQGSEATAVIPVIGIDTDGFWQVSYDNGTTWQRLDCKAAAEDGKTPTFRINDSGFWEVSYDNGATFDTVKDPAGKPVSAIGDNSVTDKFFAEVDVRDDMLYVKLIDGRELQIPIDSGFYCRIIGVEGVQKFSYGDERNFTVEMKGVESTVLVVPDGWKAILSDPSDDLRATLTVSAPGGTRALADSAHDIAIEATSASGLSCIAKLRVECEGDKPQTPPTISVAASSTVSPAENSLTFDVQASADSNGWKYMLLTADAAAPSADDIFENGTAGTTLSLTVDGLAASTEYRIYVVAYKELTPVLLSEVASAAATTAAEYIDPNDYYAAGVDINGIRYSRDTEGATVLDVPADAAETVELPVTTGGVFFIDDKNPTVNVGTAESIGLVSDLVIIGRNASEKATIDVGKYWALRNPDGILAFKNLKINYAGIGNYVFNAQSKGSDAGGLGTLVFEDCEITFDKALLTMYGADTGAGIGNIVFRNCKLRYEGTAATFAFITLQKTDTGLDKFRTVVFENNVIYSSKGSSAAMANSLFYQDNHTQTGSLAGSLANLDIVCRNNTFVDFISFGSALGSSYFVVGEFKSLECTGNLFYSSRTDKYPSIIRVARNYDSAWPSYNMPRTENKVYGTAGWKLFYDGSGGQKPAEVTTNTFPKLTESPLTVIDLDNGRFVKSDAVAGYGSTLE